MTQGSIARAARDLLVSVQDDIDVSDAAEVLEARARRAVDVTVHGFDTGQSDHTPDPADLLGAALSQLEIGNTLLAAQHTLGASGRTAQLGSAVLSLEDAADSMELLGKPSPEVHGFDAVSVSADASVQDAAFTALDAMSAAAADVATAVLGKTLKPLADRVPDGFADLLADKKIDIPGRLSRWGALAISHGLDLLAAVIDPRAVERSLGAQAAALLNPNVPVPGVDAAPVDPRLRAVAGCACR